MLSLNNKELLFYFINNLNTNNLEEFSSKLSDYTKLNSDRLLSNFKQLLNNIIGRVDLIHQSSVINNFEEYSNKTNSTKPVTMADEAEMENLKQFKEFSEKYSSELKTIKVYL